ncbi:MAG: sigma-E processing peptidase SpoIIGA [Clostridia bacterium]|nr:sigma-E processing peptidase SpoIIGA [Clostridia bacterium]
MSVYIEPLIVQNLLLTYCIGATAYRFTRVKREWWRLLLTAMLGSAASLFYPLISLPAVLSAVLKIALGFALSAVLFAGKSGYLKGTAAFFIATFVFGGCVFFAGCLRYKSASDAFNKPLSVGFCTAVISAIVLYNLFRAVCSVYHRKTDLSATLCRYSLTFCGKEIDGNGFIDTGNRLYDSVSGLPVVVLGIKALIPFISDNELTSLLSGRADRVFKGARRLSCKSVSGVTDMWIVPSEKFEVYFDEGKNIVYDVMVGLSFSQLAGGESYNAILPALTESFT